MFWHQSSGKNHYVKAANKPSENVAKLKHLETMLTNKNCIHEDINSRLNWRNACHHATQNLLPSPLVPHCVKIKIYKSIILLFLGGGVLTSNKTPHSL
jgi:hypothetical protein